MEKISIFNYEAFYLDFLEGNLNEADTALFLEFLDNNPDLKMVNDGLPTFSKENIVLDVKTKESLKHHSEDEVVVMANIDHFLIAQSEGILSEEKAKEVDSFVAANASLAKEKILYGSVYFKADESIVFANKQSLKRKKALVLWPYYAAAASVVIAMLVWYSNSNGRLEEQRLFAEQEAPKKDKSKNFVVKEKTNETTEKEPLESVEDVNSNTTPVNSERRNSPKRIENRVPEDGVENKFPIADNSPKKNEEKNSKQHKKPIIKSIEDIQLQAITNDENLASNEVVSNNNTDYASVYFADVSNPIEPITSFVAKKAKTDVDFRRQKKTTTKPSSFYVKIGKFEFSRKKH